jgi:hypothetical protein
MPLTFTLLLLGVFFIKKFFQNDFNLTILFKSHGVYLSILAFWVSNFIRVIIFIPFSSSFYYHICVLLFGSINSVIITYFIMNPSTKNLPKQILQHLDESINFEEFLQSYLGKYLLESIPKIIEFLIQLRVRVYQFFIFYCIFKIVYYLIPQQSVATW